MQPSYTVYIFTAQRIKKFNTVAHSKLLRYKHCVKLNYHTMFCSLYSYAPSTLFAPCPHCKPATRKHNNIASILMNLFTIKVRISTIMHCAASFYIIEFGPFAGMQFSPMFLQSLYLEVVTHTIFNKMQKYNKTGAAKGIVSPFLPG